jgi:hypothetical protein
LNALNPWSQILPGAGRFDPALNGAAVLDKETGLVWEQAPDSDSVAFDRKSWFAARAFCNTRVVGNRKGWRLPTVQELASLFDPSSPAAPKLPDGHPFVNVQPLPGSGLGPFAYWSATSQNEDPNSAWFVDFSDGNVFTFAKDPTPDYRLFAWCVRGGHAGTDTQ